MFDLRGKRALVTGSTQGIGFGIASCFAEQGAEVYVHGRTSMEKILCAARKMEGTVHPALADLGRADCADILFDQTGDVDILVLNASIQIRKAWNAVTIDDFERQINTNLRASMLLIQKYAPAMLAKHWGRIITVGSVQQVKPHKQMLVYAAGKCAQMSMVRNLARQFALDGVTVNNISPGVIRSPRNEEALADPAYSRQVLAGIPLGYVGETDDCTGAALLLASGEGRYITGIDLAIDGGMGL